MPVSRGHSEDRLAEWLLSSIMIAWGFGLALPSDTFQLPSYRYLAVLMREEVWASWAISVGMLRIFALYVGASLSRAPAIRCGVAIFGMLWWALLTVSFLTAVADFNTPLPAMVAMCPVFVIFEAKSAGRSAHDAFHTQAFRKWPLLTRARR